MEMEWKEYENQIIKKANELLNLIKAYEKERKVLPFKYRLLKLELIQFVLSNR